MVAKRRIRELETELAIHRRATELLKEKTSPKKEAPTFAIPGIYVDSHRRHPLMMLLLDAISSPSKVPSAAYSPVRFNG